MSTKSVLDFLGAESKKTLLNLAITPKDLIGKVDFNDSISQENAVSTEYANGKINTKIRIQNNVIIFKEDLKEIPLLLEYISQSDLNGPSLPLNSFSIEKQIKISLAFMQHYGYVVKVGNEEYFTPHIQLIFGSDWWINIFNLAKQKTLISIDREVEIGNQPIKNKEIIVGSGLISVKEFKAIQTEPGMNILWALGIYFFEKIVRNWNDQEIPEQIYTETLMDADMSPGKYVKEMNPKKFFIDQLRIFLGLRPSSIWFGHGYHSKFQELIQKKISILSKKIILEEMKEFTDYLNLIYSNGNELLNGPTDSGTEPFTIKDLLYSEYEMGPNTVINLSIILQINTYRSSKIYTLPVNTRIN